MLKNHLTCLAEQSTSTVIAKPWLIVLSEFPFGGSSSQTSPSPHSIHIFPILILPNRLITELQKNYAFHVWSKVDAENSAIRLVSSWATKEDAVQVFIEDLKSATSALITEGGQTGA